MRILDKNTDFYDYLQNVYRDYSTTFDRTDSFVLTKEIMCEHLQTRRLWWLKQFDGYNFVLLQVCHTSWLFLVNVTEMNEYGKPLDYTAELLTTWKNYNKGRELIRLDVIDFPSYASFGIPPWYKDTENSRDFKFNVQKGIDSITKAVDTSDYRVISSVNRHTVFYGGGKKVEKHIPLLKASGFSGNIEALDIYLAFDEYFSLEKTASERIYSKGITDKEKIENHGFDIKTSFRGK